VRIRELLAEGLNLAGIARVLTLETRVSHLETLNRRLRRRLAQSAV
jgi:MerR family transcriptional regulator/heat shock protein HspR